MFDYALLDINHTWNLTSIYKNKYKKKLTKNK